MTNGEMFAEVFGFQLTRMCISPAEFDCGQCPYWKWLDKTYEGRRDKDGEAEYCAKFQSAGAKRSE